MIEFLLQRFVKDLPTTSADPQVRQRYGVLAGGVGIFLNLLLSPGEAGRRAAHGLHRCHGRRLQQPVRCRFLGGDPGGLPAGRGQGRRRAPLRPRRGSSIWPAWRCRRPSCWWGWSWSRPLWRRSSTRRRWPSPLLSTGHPGRLHLRQAMDDVSTARSPAHRIGRHGGHRGRLPLRRVATSCGTAGAGWRATSPIFHRRLGRGGGGGLCL